MFKQPLSLTVLLVFVLIGSVWAALLVMPGPAPTELRQKLTVSPLAVNAPAVPISTRLFFQPAVLETQPGQEIGVELEVDSQTNSLSGAQIFLRFDVNLLELINWQPGAFWSEPITLSQAIDNQDGHLKIVLGSLEPNQGRDSLVELIFRVNPYAQAQATRVVFEAGTQVTDPRTDSSVLAETADLTLEIQ